LEDWGCSQQGDQLKNLEENMSEENEQQLPEGVVRIPLDGTFGSGVMAEVKVYTRVSAESDALREETFKFPYAFIDQAKLVGYNTMHLIAGFAIIKTEKPNVLRELGL
jgi:hypothetical protein